MGLMDKLGRGSNLIERGYFRSMLDGEEREKDNALKAYAYYKNDISSIQQHLLNYLSSIVHPQSLRSMKPVIINYVPKIVKRLCLIYKVPPIINYSMESDAETYESVNPKLPQYRKEFHRQAKLFNTILVRPIWREDKQRFDYFILNRGLADIETSQDNPLELEEVSYNIVMYDESAEKEKTYRIEWSVDEHKAIDIENDKEVLLPGMNGVNPYGKIPFITLRLEDSEEFWGDGLSDVVAGNEHLNARLTDTFHKLYMSFGVPVGINLGIQAETFYLAPNKPIMVDNVQPGDVTPRLDFITPDQKVELDRVVNDWFKSELGIAHGLSAASMTSTETAQSGYAKMIDNLELIDLNEDDKPTLRQFEKELFDLEKLILSKESASIALRGEVASVEFGKYSFPESEAEVWTRRENEYKYNMSSPVDWLREKRPDATDEELQQQLQDNGNLKRSVILPSERPVTRIEELMNKAQNG